MDDTQAVLSEVIYPECHLNSPIVLGKTIQLHLFLGLQHSYDVSDRTLEVNYGNRPRGFKRSWRETNISRMRSVITGGDTDVRKYKSERYPDGNMWLFRLHDESLSQELSGLLKKADHSFELIRNQVVEMYKGVVTDLTGDTDSANSATKEDEELCRGMTENMRKNDWYQPFLFWFTLKKEMRSLRKEVSTQRRRGHAGYQVKNCWFGDVVVHPEFALITNKAEKRYHLLSFEVVLLMSDVVEGRLMISHTAMHDHKLIKIGQKGERLWALLDSLFAILGNKTYDVVSLLEPLSLALIQLSDPVSELKGAFLNHVMGEMLSALKDARVLSTESIDDFITVLIDTVRGSTDDETSEIFSYFRTFGHPILEAITAADKVREHMTKPKLLSFKTLMEGHAVFCGIIINGYRERHGGSWPPCVMPENADEEIRSLHFNHAAVSMDICVRHWSSFVGFEFTKFLDVVLDEDLTIFMKDKALSPNREVWDSVYPSDVLGYKSPLNPDSRRLIDVFLDDAEFDPKNIIDYVESGEYLEDESFNISYSLKEKEIKQAGRLFAKMTYKMRAAQVLSESLIAGGVGRYFSENGMAKDEHELMKSLTGLSLSGVPRDNSLGAVSESSRKDMSNKSREASTSVRASGVRRRQKDRYENRRPYSADDNHETVATFITTDLQKFCLNWRYETTSIFSKRLDEIYGLKSFFGWMHPRLEKSVLYVADPACPPPGSEHVDLNSREDEGIFIHNPKGGIEGYCQKSWTIISIAFLHLAAVRTGVRISAVIQGDNEAIAVTTRVKCNQTYQQKKEESYIKAMNYFDELRRTMAGIGHNLKLNETLVSSNFFVYSKRVYYDGKVLSQSLKSMSRCVFWSETLVDETRAACSNIGTATAKSIENGLSPLPGYLITIQKTMQQLVVAVGFSINTMMTKDVTGPILASPVWLAVAVITPSQLGGFNYMNLARLFVRNIGDPLVAAYADIKRMIKAGIITTTVLSKFMLQEPGDSSFLDWAGDPYSANLPHSQSITSVIKHIAARGALTQSPNPMLEGLFHENTEDEDKELAVFLMDRGKIMPRVAHVIMENSVTGAREAIAGLLDTTKTMIRSSIRLGALSKRLTFKLANHDYQQFVVFNKVMKLQIREEVDYSDVCSVTLAKVMRSRMWIHLACGREILGLEVPDPLESLRGHIIRGFENCSLCELEHRHYAWFFVPADESLTRITENTNQIRVPYFGSTTQERSEVQLGFARGLSKAAKSAIRIATVYTWAYGDDDLSWSEAHMLASSRGNFTIDQLRTLTPQSTATNLSHRLRDSVTQMKFSSTSLQRVSRYVTISNDNLSIKHAGESIDTNLIYQQVMLVGLGVLELLYSDDSTTGSKNTVYHLHVRTDCCIEETKDPDSVPSTQEFPDITEQHSNPVIYDPSPLRTESIQLIKSVATYIHEVEFFKWSDEEVINGLSICTAQTIEEQVSAADKDNLKEIKATGVEDNVNSLITEFLLVDCNIFVLSLGLAICSEIAYELYYRRIEGREAILDYTASKMSATSRGVLKSLRNAISHPKVFRKFWDAGFVSPTRGQSMTTQDFDGQALDLLVSSVGAFLTSWSQGQEITMYLCEQDIDVLDERRTTTEARHMALLICLYGIVKRAPVLTGLATFERHSVLNEYLQAQRISDPSGRHWSVENLSVQVIPAPITYIRRSLVKQHRIRNIQEETDEPALEGLWARGQVKSTKELDIERWQVQDLTFVTTERASQIDESEYRLPAGNYHGSQMLRLAGINSTSCIKAMELSTLLRSEIDTSGPRMFVGEGSGAMMTFYSLTWGHAKTWYNTGVSSSDVIGQREISMMPSELLLTYKNIGRLEDIHGLVTPLFNGRPETTWIGNPECEELIQSRIQDNSCALVHCDMEGGADKTNERVELEQYALVRVTHLSGRDDCRLLTKLAPKLGTNWTRVLVMFRAYFRAVRLIVLKTSNPANTEVYVLCENMILQDLLPADQALSVIDYLSEHDHAEIEQWLVEAKLRCSHWLQGQIHELTEGNRLPYVKQLMMLGFCSNTVVVARQFLHCDDLWAANVIREKMRLALMNIIREDEQAATGFRSFGTYPLSDSGTRRVLARQAVLAWVTLNLTTITTHGEPLDQSLFHEVKRNLICVKLGLLQETGNISRAALKKLTHGRGGISYAFETRELKMIWKLIGGVYQLR